MKSAIPLPAKNRHLVASQANCYLSGHSLKTDTWRLCLRFEPTLYYRWIVIDELTNAHVGKHTKEGRPPPLHRGVWRLAGQWPEASRKSGLLRHRLVVTLRPAPPYYGCFQDPRSGSRITHTHPAPRTARHPGSPSPRLAPLRRSSRSSRSGCRHRPPVPSTVRPWVLAQHIQIVAEHPTLGD